MEKPKCKVYIASPYTIGDAGTNVKVQMDMAGLLIDIGLIPFTPLLSHFLHMANPKTYRQWMDYDFEWVKSCDTLMRLPGESVGADMEMEVAENHGIPVFREFERFISWCDESGVYLENIATSKSTQFRYKEIISIDSKLFM